MGYEERWTPLWYAALHEPLGIYVQTPDPTRLKAMLYSARKVVTDADPSDPISTLIIKHSPRDPKGELWIIRPPPQRTADEPRITDTDTAPSSEPINAREVED